jgi:hypothetical protein
MVSVVTGEKSSLLPYILLPHKVSLTMKFSSQLELVAQQFVLMF